MDEHEDQPISEEVRSLLALWDELSPAVWTPLPSIVLTLLERYPHAIVEAAVRHVAPSVGPNRDSTPWLRDLREAAVALLSGATPSPLPRFSGEWKVSPSDDPYATRDDWREQIDACQAAWKALCSRDFVPSSWVLGGLLDRYPFDAVLRAVQLVAPEAGTSGFGNWVLQLKAMSELLADGRGSDRKDV